MIWVDIECPRGKPHAAPANERLIADWAPKEGVTSFFKAHRARAALGSVVHLLPDQGPPPNAQALAADARALVTFNEGRIVLPLGPAEVAEDVGWLDVVWIGAFASHRSYANAHAMTSGLSLANKVQLLFGTAVVGILAASLAVPWFRSEELIYRSQLDVSRQLAEAWIDSPAHAMGGPIPLRLVSLDEAASDEADPFLREAAARMAEDPALRELFQQVVDGNDVIYRYARALDRSLWGRIHDERNAKGRGLAGVLLIERPSRLAAGQLLETRVYIVAAWLVASLLAVYLFWFILNRVILKPVRRLRDTADKVEQGDFSVRASITTGDDFESLGESFNRMLDEIERTSSQLRSMNQSLDLKVTELAEANIGLYESNRLKSEFLANVSHELKTPLNSIIGFAELLDELASQEVSPDPKRRRYVSNIIESGRTLLEMISELLQMAKIEAGRVEVAIAPVNVQELLANLAAILRPQVETKHVTVEVLVADSMEPLETDAGKLQQILFNFMSNAIKFSPTDATVVLAAEFVSRSDASPAVRFRVSDHGPGIPNDMQKTIFEKFRQVDASHTRSHGGTGLGLAICRDLAELIGASISLVSAPGEGSTFSVEVPLTYREKELQPLIEG